MKDEMTEKSSSGWLSRLKSGLSRTTQRLTDSIAGALTRRRLDRETLQQLEEALIGLAVDDTKEVTLAPADAYGEINEEAFQEIPTDQIPEEARVVGTILGAQGYEGPIRVHEVNEEFVILDFNNPLAGRTLTFDIRIVSVN